MSAFRFLHAADIHLDSPLTGLSRYEGLPAEDVRVATRSAFDNLIRFACDEAVDFVVIAGDLFDGDWRDMGTGLYFARAMGRLDQADIPVFLLQGNHDAGSVLTRSLPWPPNVRRFGTRAAQTFRIPELGVALHGWSFAHQSAPDNLALGYPVAEDGVFNIGVLHTSLSGRPGHADYAPCDLADLRSRGYDYWALGHVHAFERVADDPAIVFPGNIQGRSIRETGAKGAVLVEVRDDVVSDIRRVELDVIRWARVSIDCGGCSAMDEVHARVREGLLAARGEVPADRGIVARVVLGGETAMAGELADAAAGLRDEARALAAGVSGELWIEKLVVAAVEPAGDAGSAVAEGVAQLLDGAASDLALAEALAAELGPFLTATAAAQSPEEEELRHAALAGDWARIADAATIGLVARLGSD